MPNVVPAQFDQGDDPLGQKFLQNLQIVAQQAADGVSLNSGTLFINYVPGAGFTIELPPLNIPAQPARLPFPAKITSTSGAACAWTALVPATPSTWANSTGDSPLSGTTSVNPAYEINGRQGFPANYQVLMWQEQANDGSIVYWFVAPNSMFPVTVERTGGLDGNVSTKATWTYTVRSLIGGVTLGSNVSVSRPRPYGSMVYQFGSSGYGVAFYDGAILRLWDAGEVEATYDCESP